MYYIISFPVLNVCCVDGRVSPPFLLHRHHTRLRAIRRPHLPSEAFYVQREARGSYSKGALDVGRSCESCFRHHRRLPVLRRLLRRRPPPLPTPASIAAPRQDPSTEPSPAPPPMPKLSPMAMPCPPSSHVPSPLPSPTPTLRPMQAPSSPPRWCQHPARPRHRCLSGHSPATATAPLIASLAASDYHAFTRAEPSAESSPDTTAVACTNGAAICSTGCPNCHSDSSANADPKSCFLIGPPRRRTSFHPCPNAATHTGTHATHNAADAASQLPPPPRAILLPSPQPPAPLQRTRRRSRLPPLLFHLGRQPLRLPRQRPQGKPRRGFATQAQPPAEPRGAAQAQRRHTRLAGCRRAKFLPSRATSPCGASVGVLLPHRPRTRRIRPVLLFPLRPPRSHQRC